MPYRAGDTPFNIQLPKLIGKSTPPTDAPTDDELPYGYEWVPDGYGGRTPKAIPKWRMEGGGGYGGGGGGGDGASAAASLRGQDLQHQLGLKGIEVDWARVDIEKQAQRTNQGSLMESIRSNKAQEASQARQRTLDATSNALTAYLKGTELADARRLSAMQESRQLLPYLVDPKQKYHSGLGPGGALQQMQSRRGLAPSTLEMEHKTLTPQVLSAPPTPQLIGGEIMKHIKSVKKAGK